LHITFMYVHTLISTSKTTLLNRLKCVIDIEISLNYRVKNDTISFNTEDKETTIYLNKIS